MSDDKIYSLPPQVFNAIWYKFQDEYPILGTTTMPDKMEIMGFTIIREQL